MPLTCLSFGPKTSFERGETAPISVKNYFKEDELLESIIWRCDPVETARNLNYITLSLAKAISNNFKLTLSEEPFATSRKKIVTCGRIFCVEKLNENTIFLEGTLEIDSGNTIRLDVSNLSKFEFFPGQVVVVKGEVIDGIFVIESCWVKGLLPLPKPVVFEKSRQIVTASGPFNVESLEILLGYIRQWRPHIIILFGPIISTDLINKTYDNYFQELMNKIEELSFEDNDVIVVASSDEIIHTRVYPSPPYFCEKNKSVLQVADPTCLNFDGFVVGLSSVDVLSHLKKVEFYKNSNSDLEERLVSYLLNQQSFYPLYPADKEARVDYPLIVKYGMMGCRPNLLILPSNLQFFAKEIEKCFVINPGRLARNDRTFARIEVISNQTISCEVLKL